MNDAGHDLIFSADLLNALLALRAGQWLKAAARFSDDAAGVDGYCIAIARTVTLYDCEHGHFRVISNRETYS